MADPDFIPADPDFIPFMPQAEARPAITPPPVQPPVNPILGEKWAGPESLQGSPFLGPMMGQMGQIPKADFGAAGQALGAVAKGTALGASMLAPAMTGGASIPIQSAVSGLAGAAQSKLMGGSNTEAAYSGAIGAAVPGIGSLLPTRQAMAAGKVLGQIKSVAGDMPVNVSEAGNAALAAKNFSDTGPPLPGVIRKFIVRATDPEKGPITFAEARDFFSNASKIARNDAARMSPNEYGKMQALLLDFKNSLGRGLTETAAQAGQGEAYTENIAKYAGAKRAQTAIKYGTRTVGTAAGLGYLYHLLGSRRF